MLLWGMSGAFYPLRYREEIRHLLNIVYGVGRRIGQVFNSIPHICPQISPGTGAASAVIFLLFIAFYVYNPMLAFLTSAQNVRGTLAFYFRH